MQQDALVGGRLLELKSDLMDNKSYPTDKWNALVKYDVEISAAAEKLRPYGDAWIDKLGREYFSLQENRAYLPDIVRVLLEEAKDEIVQKKAKAEREEAERLT